MSRIWNAVRSMTPAASRIRRCSALMIGLHQRESHSCSRGITASPYSLEQAGVGLVPVRPLPARGLEEERAELLLGVVHRRLPLAAVGLVLLGRVDDPVGLDERLGGAQPGVLAALLVLVEPRDVAVADVDLAVAVGHPLGHRAADARSLLDPHRGGGPEPLHVALAEDRQAVAGEGEQAVDGVAHLRALGAEQLGHQLVGLLELRVEVVAGERQLGRRQLRLVDRGDVLGLHAGSRGARRSRPPCRRRAGARSRRCPCRGRSGRRSRPRGRPAAGTGPTLIIWCTAGVSGMLTPAMSPILGIHTPQAMTTVSASMSPPLVQTLRDPTVGHLEVGHLDVRYDGEHALLQRPLAHDRAGAQRVDDADAAAARRRR